MIANEFVIELDDSPGELARVCELLGKNGVNLKAIATDRVGHQRFIRIVVDNDKKVMQLLEDGDFMFTANDVVIKSVADKPNSLTEIARKLGKQGVNIEAIYMLSRGNDKVNLVFSLDNAQRGAEILKK
ncbi:MAG: hypothetical protein KAW41_00270 [Candidatus Diapherotrites archaeon]|nr:hypothetical protein [Candidatus Diapherotrites archaeon]